jgi:hypothetical protein
MVAITATVVGSVSPQAVQVAVSGMASGDAFEVVGVWSGGSWPVRGGTGVADGSLLVLTDFAAPINVPVTYRVTTGIDVIDSAPVTVAFGARYALSSLDGRVVVPAAAGRGLLMDNGLSRSRGMRQAVFNIPGRSDPVAIVDRPTSGTGELVARTDRDGSRLMDALLDLGGMALLRTDGSVRDLPASTFLLIMAVSSSLTGHADDRDWTLGYRLMADPEPGTVVTASDLDDLEAAYAGLTLGDVKAEWAGLTLDDFAVEDWASRA